LALLLPVSDLGILSEGTSIPIFVKLLGSSKVDIRMQAIGHREELPNHLINKEI
jgi:hypothetical protein